mgnify:FL=1
MANCITRHIPNAVTCCNLFSGCIASVMAFNEDYTLAISFIILGAVFDFFCHNAFLQSNFQILFSKIN